MGNTVTVIKGDVTEVFVDVIGHQIGNGAIQVLERSGNQRIINSFDDVKVELDEDAAAQFAFDVQEMEAGAVARSEAGATGTHIPREPEDEKLEDPDYYNSLDVEDEAEEEAVTDEADEPVKH